MPAGWFSGLGPDSDGLTLDAAGNCCIIRRIGSIRQTTSDARIPLVVWLIFGYSSGAKRPGLVYQFEFWYELCSVSTSPE